MSTTFSRDFGPHKAVTDARQEGEPSVLIWTDFALRKNFSIMDSKGNIPKYPLSCWLLTVKRMPGSAAQGPSAYALSSDKALAYSRLIFLSNSFRRTASGEKILVRVILVPC